MGSKSKSKDRQGSKAKDDRTPAIYLRVSSNGQETKSQEPDLIRWAESHGGKVRWYRDKASGKSMDRPGWKELEKDMRAGKLAKLVCWRLDRLGRTAIELLALRDELRERKVDLVCMMDGVMGLETAAGRMMFGIIAHFAEYEREIRGERQAAGIAVARKLGRYKGRLLGAFKVVNGKRVDPARALRLRQKGFSVKEVAQAMGVSVNTVFVYLRRAKKELRIREEEAAKRGLLD
jgi:DNA invertase Pin-like site-specific DNA recombinase